MTGLEIEPAEREVLLAEIGGVLAAVREPRVRASYERLAGAVAAGLVEEELVPTLEGLVELSLDTGRARRLHGAESERTLVRLFQKTPRGTAARRATEAVNEALRALSGQELAEALFTLQAPGVWRLGLATDRVRLALEIDRHGIAVESLEV